MLLSKRLYSFLTFFYLVYSSVPEGNAPSPSQPPQYESQALVSPLAPQKEKKIRKEDPEPTMMSDDDRIIFTSKQSIASDFKRPVFSDQNAFLDTDLEATKKDGDSKIKIADVRPLTQLILEYEPFLVPPKQALRPTIQTVANYSFWDVVPQHDRGLQFKLSNGQPMPLLTACAFSLHRMVFYFAAWTEEKKGSAALYTAHLNSSNETIHQLNVDHASKPIKSLYPSTYNQDLFFFSDQLGLIQPNIQKFIKGVVDKDQYLAWTASRGINNKSISRPIVIVQGNEQKANPQIYYFDLIKKEFISKVLNKDIMCACITETKNVSNESAAASDKYLLTSLDNAGLIREHTIAHDLQNRLWKKSRIYAVEGYAPLNNAWTLPWLRRSNKDTSLLGLVEKDAKALMIRITLLQLLKNTKVIRISTHEVLIKGTKANSCPIREVFFVDNSFHVLLSTGLHIVINDNGETLIFDHQISIVQAHVCHDFDKTLLTVLYEGLEEQFRSMPIVLDMDQFMRDCKTPVNIINNNWIKKDLGEEKKEPEKKQKEGHDGDVDTHLEEAKKALQIKIDEILASHLVQAEKLSINLDLAKKIFAITGLKLIPSPLAMPSDNDLDSKNALATHSLWDVVKSKAAADIGLRLDLVSITGKDKLQPFTAATYNPYNHIIRFSTWDGKLKRSFLYETTVHLDKTNYVFDISYLAGNLKLADAPILTIYSACHPSAHYFSSDRILIRLDEETVNQYFPINEPYWQCSNGRNELSKSQTSILLHGPVYRPIMFFLIKADVERYTQFKLPPHALTACITETKPSASSKEYLLTWMEQNGSFLDIPIQNLATSTTNSIHYCPSKRFFSRSTAFNPEFHDDYMPLISRCPENTSFVGLVESSLVYLKLTIRILKLSRGKVQLKNTHELVFSDNFVDFVGQAVRANPVRSLFWTGTLFNMILGNGLHLILGPTGKAVILEHRMTVIGAHAMYDDDGKTSVSMIYSGEWRKSPVILYMNNIVKALREQKLVPDDEPELDKEDKLNNKRKHNNMDDQYPDVYDESDKHLVYDDFKTDVKKMSLSLESLIKLETLSFKCNSLAKKIFWEMFLQTPNSVKMLKIDNMIPSCSLTTVAYNHHLDNAFYACWNPVRQVNFLFMGSVKDRKNVEDLSHVTREFKFSEFPVLRIFPFSYDLDFNLAATKFHMVLPEETAHYDTMEPYWQASVGLNEKSRKRHCVLINTPFQKSGHLLFYFNPIDKFYHEERLSPKTLASCLTEKSLSSSKNDHSDKDFFDDDFMVTWMENDGMVFEMDITSISKFRQPKIKRYLPDRVTFTKPNFDDQTKPLMRRCMDNLRLLGLVEFDPSYTCIKVSILELNEEKKASRPGMTMTGSITFKASHELLLNHMIFNEDVPKKGSDSMRCPVRAMFFTGTSLNVILGNGLHIFLSPESKKGIVYDHCMPIISAYVDPEGLVLTMLYRKDENLRIPLVLYMKDFFPLMEGDLKTSNDVVPVPSPSSPKRLLDLEAEKHVHEKKKEEKLEEKQLPLKDSTNELKTLQNIDEQKYNVDQVQSSSTVALLKFDVSPVPGSVFKTQYFDNLKVKDFIISHTLIEGAKYSFWDFVDKDSKVATLITLHCNLKDNESITAAAYSFNTQFLYVAIWDHVIHSNQLYFGQLEGENRQVSKCNYLILGELSGKRQSVNSLIPQSDSKKPQNLFFATSRILSTEYPDDLNQDVIKGGPFWSSSEGQSLKSRSRPCFLSTVPTFSFSLLNKKDNTFTKLKIGKEGKVLTGCIMDTQEAEYLLLVLYSDGSFEDYVIDRMRFTEKNDNEPSQRYKANQKFKPEDDLGNMISPLLVRSLSDKSVLGVVQDDKRSGRLLVHLLKLTTANRVSLLASHNLSLTRTDLREGETTVIRTVFFTNTILHVILANGMHLILDPNAEAPLILDHQMYITHAHTPINYISPSLTLVYDGHIRSTPVIIDMSVFVNKLHKKLSPPIKQENDDDVESDNDDAFDQDSETEYEMGEKDKEELDRAVRLSLIEQKAEDVQDNQGTKDILSHNNDSGESQTSTTPITKSPEPSTFIPPSPLSIKASIIDLEVRQVAVNMKSFVRMSSVAHVPRTAVGPPLLCAATFVNALRFLTIDSDDKYTDEMIHSSSIRGLIRDIKLVQVSPYQAGNVYARTNEALLEINSTNYFPVYSGKVTPKDWSVHPNGQLLLFKEFKTNALYLKSKKTDAKNCKSKDAWNWKRQVPGLCAYFLQNNLFWIDSKEYKLHKTPWKTIVSDCDPDGKFPINTGSVINTPDLSSLVTCKSMLLVKRGVKIGDNNSSSYEMAAIYTPEKTLAVIDLKSPASFFSIPLSNESLIPGCLDHPVLFEFTFKRKILLHILTFKCFYFQIDVEEQSIKCTKLTIPDHDQVTTTSNILVESASLDEDGKEMIVLFTNFAYQVYGYKLM